MDGSVDGMAGDVRLRGSANLYALRLGRHQGADMHA